MARMGSGKSKPSPLTNTPERETKTSNTSVETLTGKRLPSKRSRKPVKDKEWVAKAEERKQNLSLQRWWTVCGIWTYTFALTSSFLIIFLNGFHVLGFTISDTFLKYLEGTTVGQIGGLVLLLVTKSWEKRH